MRGYGLPLWGEDRLLFVIVAWTSILSSWLWWVPIRCVMDGPAFEWSNSFGFGVLRGAGMGGHFLVLVLLSSLFIGIVYMGWRGARAPFGALLGVWCAVNLAGTLLIVIDDPSRYRFRGDTMGIDINMAWFMPALKAGLVVCVGWWLVREWRAPSRRTSPEWTPLNTKLLAPVVVLVPFQVVLLRFGPMHDVTDQIGWILTYGEWVLINLALLPWVRRDARGATA